MYDDEDIMNLDDESGPRYSRLGQFVIQSCPGSRSVTPLSRSTSGISRSKSAKLRSSGNDVQHAILRLSVADDTTAISRSRHSVGMATLWVPVEPGRLHLVHMTPQEAHNPTNAIHHYIRTHFHLTQEDYTLASLMPGMSYPIPVMRFATDLNKGIVLCLPTSKLELNIHIQHLVKTGKDKVKFKSMKVSAGALQKIKDLKEYIQKTRGIPTSIQELVYNGHALQNSKLLLDYNISSGTKIHLLLQPMKSFSVLCKTFWGKSYHVEVNACTTVEELIDQVLLQTLSDNHTGEDIESIFGPRAMYKHLILAEYQEVVLDKQSCLNHFSITKDSCVNISASSEMRRDTHRFVQVATETTLCEVHCGSYDTWLMAALRLHGQTGVPLDKMQLSINDKSLDFKNTIGSIRLEGTIVKMNSTIELGSLPLIVHVRLPSGHTETINTYHRTMIKDLKTILETRGVHNAQLYDLQYKRVILPPNSRLSEFRLPDYVTLEMMMGEFPISATHGSGSARILVHMDQALGSVLKKLEDRLGISPLKHCVLHAGEDLYNYDTVRVGESFLHLHSHLYVEYLPPATPVLHLVAGEDVIPLAIKSTMDSLAMQQIASLVVDTTTMMDSLKWFIKWRFPDKARNLSQARQQNIPVSLSRHHSFHNNNGRANASPSSSDKIIMTSLHRSHSLHQARTVPNLRASKYVVKQTEASSNSKSYNMSPGAKTASPSMKKKESSKTLPHLSHTLEPHAPSTTAMPRKPAIKSSAPTTNGYHVKHVAKVSGKDHSTNFKKKLSVRFEIPSTENEYEKLELQHKDGSKKGSGEFRLHRSKSSITGEHRMIRGSVSYPMNGLRNSQSGTVNGNKFSYNRVLLQSLE